MWRLMLALPIFTASRPATIVGASELNFCVRDGNRWTLTAINTNCVLSISKNINIIAPFSRLSRTFFALPQKGTLVTRGRVELPFAA